ncbi:hypothetical protein GCM10020219_012510 [Nonomuraea dietziae]
MKRHAYQPGASIYGAVSRETEAAGAGLRGPDRRRQQRAAGGDAAQPAGAGGGQEKGSLSEEQRARRREGSRDQEKGKGGEESRAEPYDSIRPAKGTCRSRESCPVRNPPSDLEWFHVKRDARTSFPMAIGRKVRGVVSRETTPPTSSIRGLGCAACLRTPLPEGKAGSAGGA